MGALRLFLAVAVVISHTGAVYGWVPMPGRVAVQTFYIISGFYIALILNEKYTGAGSYRLFLSNRFLRLFPAYWVVLVAALGFWLVSARGGGSPGPLALYSQPVGLLARASLTLANLGIFGQDWALFLGVRPGGGLFFTPDFRLTQPPVRSFLLVPQAWSLGVELSFYVLAPFLVRRRPAAVAGLLLASLGLRGLLFFACGCDHDPWTYRFFPAELAFFLAGVLAYHVYRRLRVRNLSGPRLAVPGGVFLLYCASYAFLPAWTVGGLLAKQLCLYLLAPLAVPVLFSWCKANKVDRYVGELSYPVYVSHVLVIVALKQFAPRLSEGPLFGLAVTAVSLACAVALMQFVMEPVEKIRQRRVERAKAALAPEPAVEKRLMAA